MLRRHGREEAIPLSARATVFHQLQEHTTRAPAAIASAGQHATIAFNRQRVGQDRSAALLPERLEDPGEQGLLGLLEDRSEPVSREGVHTGLSSLVYALGPARGLWPGAWPGASRVSALYHTRDSHQTCCSSAAIARCHDSRGREDTACLAGTCWCHTVARRQVWCSRVSARQPVLGAACMALPDTRPPLRLLALSYYWNTDHCLLVWSAALWPA